MSTVLTELFRHSFPKGLRFCGQCKTLHSALTVVVKRNKNRRFINKAEITAATNLFTPAPYAWMRNPIVKRLLMLNAVNQIRRGLYKRPYWMLSGAIEAEHAKLLQWLATYEACGGSMSGVTWAGDRTERTTASGSKGFSVDRGVGVGVGGATNVGGASSGASASGEAAATNAVPSIGKKGKWSAAKYARGNNASPDGKKSVPAASSSVPTTSDKSLASGGFKTTRGAAADLAEEANRNAAPLSSGSASSKPLGTAAAAAFRQVFGGASGGAATDSAAADASSGAAGSKQQGQSKASSSSSRNSGSSSSADDGGSQWGSTNRNAKEFVEREVFEKSYMGNFHVAMYYHFSFIAGAGIVFVCLVQLFAIFFTHHVYFYGERARGRADTVDAIARAHTAVEENHITVEVPAEFQDRLPPPAVLMPAASAPKRRLELTKADDGYIAPPPKADGDADASSSAEGEKQQQKPKRRVIDPRTGKPLTGTDGNNKPSDTLFNEAGVDGASDVYVLNAVELTSPNGKIKVIFIPSPVLAPEGFYKEQGAILRQADAVLLEGVALTETHRQPASTFFPLHDTLFAPYGLSHRFYDVLSSSREPPMLLPAALPTSWARWAQLFVLPFPYVAVHRPELMAGSKGEARVAWSWLLDTLDMVADMDTSAGPAQLGGSGSSSSSPSSPGTSKVSSDNTTGVMAPASHGGLAAKAGAAVVAIPWTVNQIANMEASLLNRGYTVTGVLPMRWMERGQMGRAMAGYFGVTEGNTSPICDAAPPATASA